VGRRWGTAVTAKVSLDQPLVPLAVALRLLAATEAKLATAAPAEKSAAPRKSGSISRVAEAQISACLNLTWYCERSSDLVSAHR
jgi:hypothetical protein